MKSFWFDQVCVDQAQKEVKAQILQTIPAFIAKSNEMLVLQLGGGLEGLLCCGEGWFGGNRDVLFLIFPQIAKLWGSYFK